jgi:hypothetical protein
LRPWRAFATQLLFFLHPAHLRLELRIAVLELLDHSRELSDLRFEPLEPDQEIGRAGLRRALQRLSVSAALAGKPLAAAEEDVE